MLHIKVPFQDMSALWRDCLRATRNNNQSTKKELGISTWNSEGVACHFLKDKKKLDFFLFQCLEMEKKALQGMSLSNLLNVYQTAA